MAAVLPAPVDSHDFAIDQPVRITEVNLEPPGREEVLVEIQAASLCHTDVSITLGEIEESYPMVMGHEGAGIVCEVGDSVDSVAPGDHVVLGRMACGRCEFCRIGRSALCRQRTAARKGGTLRSGETRFSDSKSAEPIHHCHGVSSFSSHTVVDEEVAIKIRDDLEFRKATLLGCGVFTGFGAVANTAGVRPGAGVAVFGTGGVGLSAVQAARLCGAAPLVAVDLVDEKLEVATELGATHVLNADREDPVKRLRDIGNGGLDYAFDAVGSVSVIEQGIESIKPTGQLVLVGTLPATKQTVEIDFHDVVVGEKRIIGSFNGSYNLASAIPMLADLSVGDYLNLKGMISSALPLSELNIALSKLETEPVIRQVILPPGKS